jgi:hypothetical protein
MSNFFGTYAGMNAASAIHSNFIGHSAGYGATSASESNFLGTSAGSGATSASNSNFLGSLAGASATNANYSNFLGQAAGYGATSASYSNLFGYQAGESFTSNNIGSNNIIIGTNVSLPNTTANAMNLGGVLFATGTYSNTSGDPSITAVSDGKVGIGTITPGYKLHVFAPSQVSTGVPVDVMAVEIGAPTSGSKLGYGPSILFKDAPCGFNVSNLARISAVYESSGPSFLGALSFATNSDTVLPITSLPLERMRITNTGKVGIGTTTPTAFLHLKAGTAAVNTAPLKLTSGINLTTTEAGAIEYDGSHLYFTAVDSGPRYQLDQSSPITVVNSSNLFSTGLTGTGSGATSASYSNFFGNNAGYGATGADYSNFMGSGAGNAASSAPRSNFFGSGAGSSATFAADSNFLGYNAGFGATLAANSNFLGNSAGYGASSAPNSNFIGSFAGNSATSAEGSNFLGYYAGQSASSASNSNFVGYSAGGSATYASNSNFLGTSAGSSATSASNSNFIGFNAGTNATTASNSIFIGKYAGASDTVNNTGNLNDWSILLGYNTNTGGKKNSILLGGSSSGTPISNTKANQFMLADTITDVRWRGQEYTLPSAQATASGQVLTNNGSGGLSWAAVSGVSSPITVVPSSNLFSTGLVGTGAGVTAINDSNFFGQLAGQGATSASQSNFLGYAAGQGATSASFSNFFGQNAGTNATGASGSNFFGAVAGYAATDASHSNFLGGSAGESAAFADHSNFIGAGAGAVATNANDSNFLGSNAGYHATSAYYSNFLGTSAGNLATNASYSNFIGSSAGDGAHHAYDSNFFGQLAGQGATSAYNSNFLGYMSGNAATSAYNSNFFGQHAGDGATSAFLSNFFGPYAGADAPSANQSNFIGNSAGADATSASNSNFIGTGAGSMSANASYSNFIGYAAGENAPSASYSNLFGYRVGAYSAGNYIGSNNIIIGTNVSLPNATANAMNLGGVLFATGTYSTTTGDLSITAVSGGKVGIGVVSPSTILEIGSSDLGDGVAGPIITLGRNTNATNTGAGSINFLGKAGTAGYVWQDAAGNMRINTSAPTNAGDTLGTVIGAQTSTRDTKTEITPYTDYSEALAMITNAPLNTFRYIKEVEGYGTNSPLAKTRIGFIADEVNPMFMVGNSIDQVSVNGLLMASIKELDLKINDLSSLDTTSATSLGSLIKNFLADVGNGIGDFYANRVRTKQICVAKADGTEFCADGDKLEAMANSSTSSIGGNTGGGSGSGSDNSGDIPPSVDDNLAKANTDAEELTAESYTAESWSTFTTALATAQELPEKNDEDKIAKTTAINDAVAELVPIENTILADLTAYDTALEAKIETDYTSESWATYQAVVDANVMADTNTQTEVDAATSNITIAQSSLVPACTSTQTLSEDGSCIESTQ